MKRSGPMRRTPFKRKPLRREPMDPDLRDAVLRRDGHSCQLRHLVEHDCRGEPHVHHIRLRSQGGEDSMDNLVTLCPDAHDWVHNRDRARAEALGLIVRAGR
jgi:5-methylcytosine-specific restriction endonuclease McrA